MKTTGVMFKYFGSKFSKFHLYPTPNTSTIIEPYAGGAGFSLNYSNRNIIISEKNPEVFLLWQYLIKHLTSNDILSIPLNLPIGTDIRELDLSDGQRLLLKYWQRTNNISACWTISKWGNLNGQWTKGTRKRLSEEIKLIKHWELYRTAEEVFEKYKNDPNIYWFIDPPYQFNYRYNESSEFNYVKLLEYINEIKGFVVVCEGKSKCGMLPTYLPFKELYKSKKKYSKQYSNIASVELIYKNFKEKSLI